MPVIVKSYTSPTLGLLAFDWPESVDHNNFPGFAVERTPGFGGAAASWLPNRIGFDGPKPDGGDFASSDAPIQKFCWWDARIDTKDRGQVFTYRVVPIVGAPDNLQRVDAQSVQIQVPIPTVTENGITSHFNRAVLSSQAFSARFPKLDSPALPQSRPRLAGERHGAGNSGVPRRRQREAHRRCHLPPSRDDTWIIPALRNYGGSVSLAYNHTSKDDKSDAAIQQLIASGRQKPFAQRTHASTMHDKFLVRIGAADHAEAVDVGFDSCWRARQISPRRRRSESGPAQFPSATRQ